MMKYLIKSILGIILILFSCEQKVENRQTELTDLPDELLSKERIKPILNRKIDLVQIQYLNDGTLYPQMSLPRDYEYEITDKYYFEDAEYEPDDFDEYVWGDLTIREDKAVKISIETELHYSSYGISEHILLLPSKKEDAITFDKLKKSITDLEDEAWEDLVIDYQDANSVIYSVNNDFNVVYFEYDAIHEYFIVYQAVIDMADLNAKENFEMALFSLSIAKNLTKAPDKGQDFVFNSWADYVTAYPIVTIKSYDFSLKDVAKEMQVFMEESQEIDLRSMYNYSTFEFYYASEAFDTSFLSIVNSLENGFVLEKNLSKNTNEGKVEWEFREKTFSSDGFMVDVKREGNAYIITQENKNYDDEISFEYHFYYRIEKNKKVFYFRKELGNQNEAGFYNKMLDYYMEHNTLMIK